MCGEWPSPGGETKSHSCPWAETAKPDSLVSQMTESGSQSSLSESSFLTSNSA